MRVTVDQQAASGAGGAQRETSNPAEFWCGLSHVALLCKRDPCGWQLVFICPAACTLSGVTPGTRQSTLQESYQIERLKHLECERFVVFFLPIRAFLFTMTFPVLQEQA